MRCELRGIAWPLAGGEVARQRPSTWRRKRREVPGRDPGASVDAAPYEQDETPARSHRQHEGPAHNRGPGHARQSLQIGHDAAVTSNE